MIDRPWFLAMFIAVLSSVQTHDLLSFNRYYEEEGRLRLSSAKIGEFLLFWDSVDPYFYAIHSDEPEKVVFQTIPSQSFITVGYATDSRPPIVDGNYKVRYTRSHEFLFVFLFSCLLLLLLLVV